MHFVLALVLFFWSCSGSEEFKRTFSPQASTLSYINFACLNQLGEIYPYKRGEVSEDILNNVPQYEFSSFSLEFKRATYGGEYIIYAPDVTKNTVGLLYLFEENASARADFVVNPYRFVIQNFEPNAKMHLATALLAVPMKFDCSIKGTCTTTSCGYIWQLQLETTDFGDNDEVNIWK